MFKLSICCLLAVAATSSVAGADVINAVITADNHYAMYSGNSGGVVYHGGNEVGAGGAPGTYNWSEAETLTFNTTGEYLYIAAWSDDSVAQGLLAALLINGVDYSTGHAAWQVYRTNDNRGDGDPHPTTAQVAGYVGDADNSTFGRTWETPYVGGLNGAVSPWGLIAGINTTTAHWTWVSNPASANPFEPGSAYGEMLIFRMPVPTPGSAALLGLGVLAAARRRRV